VVAVVAIAAAACSGGSHDSTAPVRPANARTFWFVQDSGTFHTTGVVDLDKHVHEVTSDDRAIGSRIVEVEVANVRYVNTLTINNKIVHGWCRSSQSLAILPSSPFNAVETFVRPPLFKKVGPALIVGAATPHYHGVVVGGDAWVDAHDRIVKELVNEAGVRITVNYSDFGAPVQVHLPLHAPAC
jgi:hypothetical protein